MRAHTQSPATKAELVRLKHELLVSREGLELLERKRDSMMAEGLALLKRAKVLRLHVTENWVRIEQAWRETQSHTSLDKLKHLASLLEPLPTIEDSVKRWMSVTMASYLYQSPVLTPLAGVAQVDIRPEQLRGSLAKLLPELVELMNLETNTRRLAIALKQCHRKVNALTEVVIPDLEREKKRIEQRLEEKDREAIFQVKLLKARLS